MIVLWWEGTGLGDPEGPLQSYIPDLDPRRKLSESLATSSLVFLSKDSNHVCVAVWSLPSSFCKSHRCPLFPYPSSVCHLDAVKKWVIIPHWQDGVKSNFMLYPFLGSKVDRIFSNQQSKSFSFILKLSFLYPITKPLNWSNKLVLFKAN